MMYSRGVAVGEIIYEVPQENKVLACAIDVNLPVYNPKCTTKVIIVLQRKNM